MKARLTYAFDIDGTITAHPMHLGAMMKALVDQGQRVIILTGTKTDCAMTIQDKERQLADLCAHINRGTHYEDIYMANAMEPIEWFKQKGEICRAQGVDVLFENEMDAVRWVKAKSVNTVVAMIIP